MLSPQQLTVHVPLKNFILPSSPPPQAAPILCAGVTTYAAIKATQAKPGQYLTIIGGTTVSRKSLSFLNVILTCLIVPLFIPLSLSAAGGLGHLAVQYGVAMGLRVIAIDVGQDKLVRFVGMGSRFLWLDRETPGRNMHDHLSLLPTPSTQTPTLNPANTTQDFCASLGAEMGFEALDSDLVSKLVAATKGGSHAVLCLAPSVGAFKSAVGICRRGGTIVMVGLPKGELPLPIFDVVLRGITVRGSIVGASVGGSMVKI